MKKLAMILVLAATLTACESETLTESRSGAGVSVSGTWQGFLRSVNFLPADIVATFQLRQQDLIDPGDPDASRVVITGILSFLRRQYADCAAGGTVDSEASTLIGNRIDITVTSAAGITFNFSGVATERRMEGQYLAQGNCTVEGEESAESEESGDGTAATPVEIAISHTGTFSFTR